MNSILSASQRFYAYQKERFPIFFLGIGLLPALLSSAVLVAPTPTPYRVAIALLASLAYLLHIRIIDEKRDFEHDNVHHPDRPIQSGVISKKELRYADILAVCLLIVIAVVSGIVATAIALSMLAYSYIAGKEFFIGEKLRGFFFTYNAVNLIQMPLMQLFVYAVFANPVPLRPILFGHFIFTTLGTVVLEFTRKLKIPGTDGTGADTYTWYLGFGNSILVLTSLTVLTIGAFTWLIATVAAVSYITSCLAVTTAGNMLVSIALHWTKRLPQSDRWMQLSFFIMYGTFNLLIFFAAQ